VTIENLGEIHVYHHFFQFKKNIFFIKKIEKKSVRKMNFSKYSTV